MKSGSVVTEYVQKNSVLPGQMSLQHVTLWHPYCIVYHTAVYVISVKAVGAWILVSYMAGTVIADMRAHKTQA